MKQAILLTIISLALGSGGCLVNPYSSDPRERMDGLINDSERLRLLQEDLKRFVGHDCPPHTHPDTLDGTIVP